MQFTSTLVLILARVLTNWIRHIQIVRGRLGYSRTSLPGNFRLAAQKRSSRSGGVGSGPESLNWSKSGRHYLRQPTSIQDPRGSLSRANCRLVDRRREYRVGIVQLAGFAQAARSKSTIKSRVIGTASRLVDSSN
jgi:hypothetical protein